MANKPTKTSDTRNPLAATKYQKADVVQTSIQGSTSPSSDHVRTVVTTSQDGTLNLRYAPRKPKTSNKNTAY